MELLIDDEKHESLYFSNKVLPTIYPETFDFEEYLKDSLYIYRLSKNLYNILFDLLTHYKTIIQKVYGKKNILSIFLYRCANFYMISVL